MTSEPEASSRNPDTMFDKAADWLSQAIGTPVAFGLALAVVLGWAIAGPFAGFSTTWQLFINSFTTIATFLMVFLLANASNRLTENQDEMLEGIYGEEHRLEEEEALIRKIMERMDTRHVRPIIKHLNEQDEKLDTVLAALQRRGGEGPT
jgi:low affinity Fe/Cu permease